MELIGEVTNKRVRVEKETNVHSACSCNDLVDNDSLVRLPIEKRGLQRLTVSCRNQ